VQLVRRVPGSLRCIVIQWSSLNTGSKSGGDEQTQDPKYMQQHKGHRGAVAAEGGTAGISIIESLVMTTAVAVVEALDHILMH
jgi:hypothetical protein